MDDMPVSFLISKRNELFTRLRTSGISPAERDEATQAYVAVCAEISGREDAVRQAAIDEKLAAEAAMDARQATIRQRIAEAEAAEAAAREAAEKPATDRFGRPL